MSTVTPMDVYSSRMEIPFDVAAWCRGRKLCPESVALRRAIEDLQAKEQRINDAQAQADEAHAKYEEALTKVRQRMEREPT